MPSSSKKQQHLMQWALACKKGEAKDCPKNVKKLADSMTMEELEKYASKMEEKFTDTIGDLVIECISEMSIEDLKFLDEADGSMADNTDTMGEDIIPPPTLGMDKAKKNFVFKPDLFKVPMGKKEEQERRIMDFDGFLERLHYRTHDGQSDKSTQFGHGSNLRGK